MTLDAIGNGNQIGLSGRVFVDFDGTIAPNDPTDSLFGRFADPAWREIEGEWQQARITSTECMSRQVRLLRMTPRDLEHFLAEIKIDPAFPAFVGLCRGNGLAVSVVSDGLDLLVGSALRAAGLALPFFANRLEWQGGDRWALGFPHMKADCRVRMGNCKCAHARSECSTPSIMVGDGRSDFCIAARSDLVLAKGRLAEYCRAKGLDHVAIRDLSDANVALMRWLSRKSSRQSQQAAAAA